MKNVKETKRLSGWLRHLKAIDETLKSNKEATSITTCITGTQRSWISEQRGRLQRGELSSFQQKEFAKFTRNLKVYRMLAAKKPKPRLEKQRYEKAEQIILFKEKNERWPSTLATDKRERSLGVLIWKFRGLQQAGKLPDTVVQYMRTNNFYFDKSELLQLKIDELKNYVKDHQCLPPTTHHLYHWVYDNCHKLSLLKIRSLSSISPLSLQYARDKRRKDKEQRVFRRVKDFFRKYGKLPNRKEDKELYSWVAGLRRKLKAGTMPETTLKKFQKSGIDLLAGTFAISPWEDRLKDLEDFLERNTYQRPSQLSKDEKERKLYRWCETQKNSYKNGKLSATQIKLLNKLKFSTGSKKLINPD